MMFFNQIKMAKVKKVNSDLKELSIDAKPVASTVENSAENDCVVVQKDAIGDDENNEVDEVVTIYHGVGYSKPVSALYKVEEADILKHRELVEQGVVTGDEIAYGSKIVYKYATASKDSYFSEPWPRDIGQEKRGITFKEQ